MSLRTLTASTFEAGTTERDELVATGKWLYFNDTKRELNRTASSKGEEKPFSSTDSGMGDTEHAENSVKWAKAVLNYAAKRAYATDDTPYNETKQEILAAYTQPGTKKNKEFLAAIESIFTEVLQPMLPNAYSDIFGQMAKYESIEFGKSGLITVESNETLVWDDEAEGVMSTPAQYLYRKDITVTPSKKTAHGRVSLYKAIVDGNGTFNALFRSANNGFLALVTRIFFKTLTAAAQNAALVPAPYMANSFNRGNFTRISTNVQAANGNMPVAWFGTYETLGGFIPDNTQPGLQAQLGREYNDVGYLGRYAGKPLFELSTAIVPQTVNTTVERVDTEMPNTAWCMAMSGLSPVHVFGYDNNLTITFDSLKDPVQEIGAKFQTYLGAAAPIASKIGYISNIVV